MTRRVVAFEGKPTIDKRLLLPGSLTVKDDSIPVTTHSNTFALKIIGKATDFERNEETGAISFDIHTTKELPEKLNSHISCSELKSIMREDGVMVIGSARIREVFFSESEFGWSLEDEREPCGC